MASANPIGNYSSLLIYLFLHNIVIHKWAWNQLLQKTPLCNLSIYLYSKPPIKQQQKLTSMFAKCILNNMKSNSPFKGQQIHWTYKIKRTGQTSNKFLVYVFCIKVCSCVLLFLHLHTYLCKTILLLNNTPIQSIKSYWAVVIEGRMLGKRSLARPRSRMLDILIL